MVIFIDKDFKCHVANDGTMREFETEFFDNKCDAFIEGYRYIPAGETWVREDNVEFKGEMIAPWSDYTKLALAQANYEHKLLLEYQALLAEAEDAYESGVNSI